MKSTKALAIFYFLFCSFILISCEEILDQVETCEFDYGDLSFTKGPPNQVQEIEPTFKLPDNEGKFSANLSGLDIDVGTGIIDVNASDPGEYTITFESEQQSCRTRILILEGEFECSLTYESDLVAPGELDFLLARVEGEVAENGNFYAIPSGLAISATNGSIDVSASESGVEYTIYYTSEDEKTSCQTKLNISGIDYPDIRVALDQPEEIIVSPVYVEDGRQAAPAGLYDVEGNASQQNLAINRENGAINTLESIRNIAENEFDNNLPNGFTRTFSIAYQLPQQEIESEIEVQLFWYRSVDDIPDDLIEVFEGKGLVINGKLEKRPPYILTVGDYER